MTDSKMSLILKLLEVANKAIRSFPDYSERARLTGCHNFFTYMGIKVDDFFAKARNASEDDISHAIACVESNQWDQSEFIMSCES